MAEMAMVRGGVARSLKPVSRPLRGPEGRGPAGPERAGRPPRLPGDGTQRRPRVRAIAKVAHARGLCHPRQHVGDAAFLFTARPWRRSRGRPGPSIFRVTRTCCSGSCRGNEQWFERLHRTIDLMAIPPGAEDVFLALRGLRTMELRLREAERQGLTLAHWLSDRPEVLRVVHPALPDHPGHALWKRDFTGSSGLFSIVLKPVSEAAVAAFLDGLELFGLGYSWGGYEKLSPFPSTAQPLAPRRASRPAARRCASASASRTSRTCKRTLTGVSRASGDGVRARDRGGDP